MSRHPIQIDVVTTPTSEKGSWENINEEAYPTPLYLPIPLNHGISDESGTLLPVADIPVAGLPLACPSNSTPPRPTVPVRLLPASGISNGNFSNNTHSFTHVDSVSNFPVALILPGTLHTLPPVENREKRESQDRPHQYQKSRKKVRIPQFLCDDCGAKYVQQQGLNRHHREKHKPSLCMYCDAKWGRPYEYRDHLEKHHPNVDPDMVLGKAAGSRRRSACFASARHRPQQVSLPTIEHGQQGYSGIRRYPPAMAKPSTVTLPPPDMTYVPQPESAQPIMTSKSIPEGEHARTTWIALHGAPQAGYAGRPSNPVKILIAALNPTVDGYHGSPICTVAPEGQTWRQELQSPMRYIKPYRA